MAIEIVSFPMKKMMIFHSYVKVYQRVYLIVVVIIACVQVGQVTWVN